MTNHKTQKLNYRFYDPNPANVTAEYLLKILIEANIPKVERAIQEAARQTPESHSQTEEAPA